MGYHTELQGHFSLNRFLRPEHKAYLRRFSEILHLELDEEKLKGYPDPLREAVGLPIGKNGMYFTGLIDPDDIGDDLLLAYSYHSDRMNTLSTLGIQTEEACTPSNFCQWAPTHDGRGIQAEGEKFYWYIKWLHFLQEHFLHPWGYELSGEVSYEGEQGEHGRIIVAHGEITTEVDGDSLLPRSKESSEIDEVRKIHWMTVGSLSDAARQALLDAGGVVMDVHNEPPIVLIGISYDCNYYKRFSHDDLAIFRLEGIELHSKNLRLAWSNNNFPGKRWGGVPRKRLILPGEPYERFLPDRGEF
ncbi:hypothetical protein KSC_044530 [Ktedonobacter sp. SOSP1-52]|uniref:hypothetical protein n=1 Tax=Ktedonobacter sp. SOSP1-52 TaxID=2778366 RepID=UPI0019158F6C|nr:hypothetical protein [Ktedonobacter sp. SOSP1-52]GHO65561.1 hypothetical protein KSC_044530 [Ktedonobacter sp. SOSP1-52]